MAIRLVSFPLRSFVFLKVRRESLLPGISIATTAYLILFQVVFAVAQSRQVDSLRSSLVQQHGQSRISALNALAGAQDLIGIDSALQYAAQAFALTQDLGDGRSIVTSEYQLGFLYTLKKSDTLAIRHLRHALTLAQEIDDPLLLSNGYLKLARYYQAVNDYEKSISCASQALDIAEKHSYQDQVAAAHSRLGAVYRLIGRYRPALTHCLAALRMYEALKDTREIARTYNDLGFIYQRTEDLEDALNYFNRALKMNEALQYDNAVTGNLINIGVIHQKRNEHDEALRYYFKALPLTRQQGDRSKEAIITGNIGSTLVDQGKVAEGLGYLNKALALKEAVNIPRSILHTLNDIADARLRLNDAGGAQAAAERVVTIATQYKESDQLRYGYLNLSKSYKLAGKFDRAYYFLEKHRALNDSLFGIEKAEQMRELQIQYDTEKKDMTINALQQEKEITRAQWKIYSLAGAIVLLLLVGLYIHQRLKTKRREQLLEKEREVDRLKSEFFANISHEFRTPLSLILGPVETLLGKTGDAGDRFQLELMKKNASRLLRLINQILDLSRLQHGRVELKVSSFNAVERIKSIGATFQSLLEARSMTLKFEASHESIVLFADAGQLETICINLISNAVKFTGTGGEIVITVRKIDPAPGDHQQGALELYVRDNGIGIAADEVAHIFDRFYRAGSASEEQYGGTGIGLALTKELVELHKGSIEVTSEVGKGTTVIVRLPLGKAHFREDQVIRDHELSQERIPPSMLAESVTLEDQGPGDNGEQEPLQESQKPMVLLIEDNADVRAYVKSILDEAYILLQAVDGNEGLRQARSFVPDLIISDVMMPGMNGYEVCRQLKCDEKTSHVPVILLTAKASDDSRIEGLETEADLYLSKPFVPRELLLYINNLIQSRRKLRKRYNRQVVLKPSDIAINSMDEQFLQRLMTVVEAHFHDESFSVEQLSEEMAMSRSQLHRKLHALTNESCSQFIRTFRLQRAMEMLKKKSGTVSEIAFGVGFGSPSYFNKCFLQQYGCTPSSVMEGARVRAQGA